MCSGSELCNRVLLSVHVCLCYSVGMGWDFCVTVSRHKGIITLKKNYFQDLMVGEGSSKLVPNWPSQGSSRLTSIIFCNIVVALAYFASPIYCR